MGDEMNMHIPRSLQTFTELEEICLVPKHIISPGTSKPCIEITQDTLIGGYLLTINDIRMRRDQMNNYMMFSKKFSGQLPEPVGMENDEPYWNGKQLYSLILPDININQIKTIKIIRGKIIEGYLDSSSLGGDSGGLIKQIYNAYGVETCSDFLNDTQKLITRWMCDNSFSIGFGDCTITKDSRKIVNEITNKYIEEAYDIIKQAQHGVFANDLDDAYKSSNLEYAIMKVLSNLTEKVKDYLVSNISKSNNFYKAGDKAAGSKGNTTNIQQIMGCVGQQEIWGARIEEGFTGRTLPHFHRNDVSPSAKGFCKNSFIEGLTPSEMFFHAMGGRTGTIDTAIRTADSGYLSRKFIKAAEDLMVNYDFTVRNATSHIIQFSYGDDHFDTIKLEKVTRIELIEFDNKKVEDVYKFENIDDISYFETFMTPDAIKEMTIDENYKNLLNEEYGDILQYRHDLRYKYFANTEAIGDINTFIPINLYRVIPSILIQFNIEPHHLSDLTPKYIIDNYNECMKDIIKYLPEKENNWTLFKIIFKSFLSTKRLIKEYRMTKASFDNIILLIKEKMMNAMIHPGEMVGIIGAQTLGEVSTQLTLNSVTYETGIIVRNSNGDIKKVQIGEFIEKEIRKSNKIDYMADKDTTYAECAEYWEVQAPDEDGNIIWDRIDAVTKHPVINRDGSNTMLKITTEDEREVIATKAKSFLKLVNGKIIGVDGDNLKVGDYLPISTKAIDYRENFRIDLKTVLPPSEYVYGSELEKAKSVMKEHHWWMKHANKTFTLPHKRSDTVVQLASDRVRPGRKSKSQVLDGYVYMLLSNNCDYKVPEVLELDYNFGYLVGAYAAEGCMTDHQISISNNDATYYEPILELCNQWNITTKVYKQENKNKEGWTCQDLRIYNTILCRILEKFVGKLSHNKFIADEIIFSNKDCLRGFLDAYIGGDGSVTGSGITISSVSKKMLEQTMIILRKFDVFSHIHKPPKQESNNRGSLDIKQIYILCIYGKQSRKLSYVLNMKIKYKQDACELLKKHAHKFEYGKRFEMIPNEIDGEIEMEERDGRFIDTVFSKIKSIEEVSNTTPYAYDLTVNLTKNFLIDNFIEARDTFHLAGVGSGSLVITEGVPRLREIINVSKNLKNKNMSIYLNKDYSSNKDAARKIQSKFSYTQLKDILLKSEIIYDNKYGMTGNKEDDEFIKSYKEFSELFDIDNIDESCLSPCILRLSFDKESLMNRKISIQEVQQTIKENSHNDEDIDCVYSDDSVNDVIMRIRIKHDGKGSFMDFMKDFEKELVELPLRGIVNINQVECSEINLIQYNNDGSYQATKEWMLKTSGSNLLDILSDDAVDMSRTITNDIIEFHEIFGIEATRELIYKELFKIYNKINPKHVQLLADIMTYRGKLMQIDRHGLNKNSEIGPIGKASFEEVMNIFTKAAIFAEKDNMKGVSANILAGQFCKSGTNAFDILLDEDKLMQKFEFNEDNSSSYDKYINVNEKDVNKAFDQAYKGYEPTENVTDDDFNFGFGIEQKKEYLLEKIETRNIIVENKINNKNISNNGENDLNNISINNVVVENQDEEEQDFNNVSIDDVEIIEKDEMDENEFDNTEIDNVVVEEGNDGNEIEKEINFDEIPIDDEKVIEEEVKPKKVRVKKTAKETIDTISNLVTGKKKGKASSKNK
jgi:DNA-directed RNA polymerase beta' subunit